MGGEQKVTYCRICEAACGMVATVQDGRVTKLRPDKDHPLSRGYACPKGIAMLEVHDDPDRVTTPLRRRADGSGFDPVSWDDALDDIAARMRRIIEAHGGPSVGWYMGNPGAFSYSHPIWVKGFIDALGSQHYYTASSQDVSNRFAASALLYGSPAVVPLPDLQRTSFLLVVGANPLVSHGSLLSAPRIKDQLHAIVDRGGRVVVVDPRRSETARAFEHVPVRPDSDAWLLLSMLHVVFAEGLADEAALAEQSVGSAWLRAAVRDVTPDSVAARTGIAPDVIRSLARDLATAGSAAVYGRTGSCLGRHGTLVAFLLDALNAVTGNLDRPGGAVFGRPAISIDEAAAKAGLDTYATRRSRVGGFPEVLGAMPATLMAQEIVTPGEGALRALVVSSGNPVLSVPNGDALADALEQLELLVSIDLYVNETNRHADYVLPATSFLEREDIPLALLGFYTTPFVQWTGAVVQPRGEARQEWEIIDQLSRRLGIVPSSDATTRWLKLRLHPSRLVDLLLRTGPHGDRFGLRRGGLTLKKLRAQPHGIVLAEHLETGVLREKVRHGDGRVRLDPAVIRAALARLLDAPADDPELPLRLIGLRELRSHNSWMHNAPLLLRGGRQQTVRVHPDDAAALGLADGADTLVVSKSGELTVPVQVTDEVMPGTVAMPHGWGHHGGWTKANGIGGANVNGLASSETADVEPFSGMAWLSGIPVRLAPVAVAVPEARTATLEECSVSVSGV